MKLSIHRMKSGFYKNSEQFQNNNHFGGMKFEIYIVS